MTVDREGMCLVSVMEAGIEKVQPSAGTQGEKFAGFTTIHNLTPSERPVVEPAVIPAVAAYTVQLKWFPVVVISAVKQVRVHDDTANANLTIGNPTNAGEYSLNENTGLLTFNVAQAGHAITVYYRQVLTVAQAKLLYFQPPLNQNAFLFPHVCGVANAEGIIYTSEYDNTKDFSVGGLVKTGVNGLVTIGGNGADCGRIVAAPTADAPWLGIEFNVIKN
jgi:hypothetical protein